MKRFASKFLLIFAISIWLAAASFGLGVLLHYENSSGPQSLAASQWPRSASVSLDSSQPTLLLFAHPRCPCSRASLNELARLLANCSTKVAVHALFLQPDSTNEDWVNGDLWERAASIPGVQVHADSNGDQAKLFHATTSGFCALYSPAGQLLFSGGITGGRGHEGDNPSRTALARLIRGETTHQALLPTFGCLIRNPGPGENQ